MTAARRAPAVCPPPPRLTISEAEWQTTVIGLARLFGWRLVHIRNVKVGDRWQVPYEGDPGLPDLILARDGVVHLVELKRHGAKPTPEQRKWLAAAGSNGRLWSPSQWREVYNTLRGAA